VYTIQVTRVVDPERSLESDASGNVGYQNRTQYAGPAEHLAGDAADAQRPRDSAGHQPSSAATQAS
jgi:hypothetical protein